MSDYTPSTDEVRDAYTGHDFDQAIAAAQFDRWLAEVERAAAEKAWDACLDEAAKQGTIQEPDNPYRQERGEQ